MTLQSRRPSHPRVRRRMLRAGFIVALTFSAFACSSGTQTPGGPEASNVPSPVGGLQQLSGHLRPYFEEARVVGRVPAATPITLTIGLPVRNQGTLDAFVEAISDPKSPSYREGLTPEQFAEQFGASSEDYGAVVAWAQSKGFDVTTHRNRLFVSVAGAAADVEHAFHVHLEYALRPDGTRFYEPDAEPSLDLAVPVRFISHLDDYVVWRPAGGSGPGGDYWGKDYRNAYVADTALTGQGQSIGIFADEALFLQSDITTYNQATGMSPPTVTIVGTPGTVAGNQEELTLDIDSAQSMAPAAQIVVFNGSQDAIIANMDDNPQIAQFSSSFYPSVDSGDPNLATGLQQLAAQRQSFFTCSGDSGEYPANTWTNLNDVRAQSYVTIVGGTVLTLNSGVYGSESAWSLGGGGILSAPSDPGGGLAVPAYQVGIAAATGNTSGQVSSTYRNAPDVSALAANVTIYMTSGGVGQWIEGVGGTSIATPTWAGFMALANEAAHILGVPSVGFANPVLYSLASSPVSYAADFNDVQQGSNGYSATTGYDLATGLGSPRTPLIDALAQPVQPQRPGCTYSASTTSIGQIWVECAPDGADDPIYVFEQSGSTWNYAYDYTLPYYLQGGQEMMSGVAVGTSNTFLACTWSPVDFPSQSAWMSQVGPDQVGCDVAPTLVVIPSPPPPPAAPPPVPSVVQLEASPFWSGTSTTAVVQLTEDVTSGTVVSLAASDPLGLGRPTGLTLSGPVTLTSGETATFTVSASANALPSVDLTASANGASLTLVAPIATGSFVMSPEASPFSLKLTFRSPVPSGSVVTFTDSDPAVAGVASSVTLTNGVLTQSVPLTKGTVGSTTITGTYENSSYSAGVVVAPDKTPPPPPPPKCGDLPC